MNNSINVLAKKIHENALNHGWYSGEERSFGEIIALCHSELSEALEEHRNGKDVNEIYYNGNNNLISNIRKPEGIPVELADCIIRILDYCSYKNIDIDEAIELKHEYNKTRPYKHGGKKI